MSKIFKNMIPYWKIVIAIIGLLVVQAWCDLSLPSYTSDIIDVGIQNHGVEHVMPEKIQEEEFQTAQFIMTNQEKRIWNDIYVKKGDTKVLKNYPTVIKKLNIRHETYNNEIKKALELSKEGKVTIIAPDDGYSVTAFTRNLRELNHLYNEGYIKAGEILKN